MLQFLSAFLQATETARLPDDEVRRLLALRKSSGTLLYGHYELLLPESEEIYAYLRRLNGEEILVACNFTARSAPFMRPEGWDGAGLLLSNYETPPSGGVLRPFEAAALGR